jgi:septin family protein
MDVAKKMTFKSSLMKKSINDLLDYTEKLYVKYEKKCAEVEKLKKEKASSDVKETSKELRKENAKLKAQLEQIRKTIAPKED